ncbi:hypothetical protein D9M68_984340 [compost metagenome]
MGHIADGIAMRIAGAAAAVDVNTIRDGKTSPTRDFVVRHRTHSHDNGVDRQHLTAGKLQAAHARLAAQGNDRLAQPHYHPFRPVLP